MTAPRWRRPRRSGASVHWQQTRPSAYQTVGTHMHMHNTLAYDTRLLISSQRKRLCLVSAACC